MGLTVDNMHDDEMQLTLQVRNRKDDDKQYAKFHGDNLIAVSIRTLTAAPYIDSMLEPNISTSWFWRRSQRYLCFKELHCAQ